jgi:hypothetical protein
MTLLKTLILAAAMACPTAAFCGPSWLEADSAKAIEQRTRADFPYTVDEFYTLAREKYPELTREQFHDMISHNYVEAMSFNDTLRVFRKALRNIPLLMPRANQERFVRGADATAARHSYVDAVMADTTVGNAHRYVYRFEINVPYHPELDGDTLRVWMPIPMPSQRQSNIKILATSQPTYTLSAGQSPHSTIYFEAPVSRDGNHFEYTATFDTRGQYFSPKFIAANIKSYDKSSELYQRYTTAQSPHIVRLDSLAHAIVGDETNPAKQCELVFDYITQFPWAGAREYSTLRCIPQYVLEQRHGDCGQVSLLFISLMRSLGVPTRWESGWMLHPGEKNYHDWAEVYYEGVGWVPVDCSFGRYTTHSNPEAVNFYSHGIDSYRFATNRDICADLFPAKRFVRSETVDFQPGEVECTQGNLFYPAWSSTLQIISETDITEQQ